MSADTLAALEARMSQPDYRPILAKPAAIATTLKVSRAAVSNWASRSDRTGVHRYDGGTYDVNECLRWVLRRDEAQATRRTQTGRVVGVK
ncbi:MAG: hypothetical protein ABI047_03270 [Jatrophihabitantaceae bacterium]